MDHIMKGKERACSFSTWSLFGCPLPIQILAQFAGCPSRLLTPGHLYPEPRRTDRSRNNKAKERLVVDMLKDCYPTTIYGLKHPVLGTYNLIELNDHFVGLITKEGHLWLCWWYHHKIMWLLHTVGNKGIGNKVLPDLLQFFLNIAK